jgi:hypothetical protein
MSLTVVPATWVGTSSAGALSRAGDTRKWTITDYGQTFTVSTPSWARVTSKTSSAVTVTIDPNYSAASRSGPVVFTPNFGVTVQFTLTQSAYPVCPTIPQTGSVKVATGNYGYIDTPLGARDIAKCMFNRSTAAGTKLTITETQLRKELYGHAWVYEVHAALPVVIPESVYASAANGADIEATPDTRQWAFDAIWLVGCASSPEMGVPPPAGC